MNKKELKRFREMLLKKREELLRTADNAKEQGIGFEKDDLPDEVDLASTEAGQSLNLRLRDRELTLYKKINEAIERIDKGEYGICEVCGGDIDIKRLEARPVTTLCIDCKEEQEKREKGYAE